MQIQDGIVIFGTADANTTAQIHRVAATGPVVRAALMADNHYGYSQPIGGVVAYDNAVSPSGVGYDISCGVRATRTNLRLADMGTAWRGPVADRIAAEVSFGVGRTSAVKVDHDLFDDPLWAEKEIGALKQLAESQLGTVGSGNHFVDLLAGDDGFLWIMVHFGSRGFGHKVASGFLNLAAGRAFGDRAPGETMDAPPTVISLDTTLGQYYWQAMELAGRYAYAGRDAVVDQVLGILGATAEVTIHNHHNFAWRERHGDQDVIVVRKGATPAFPGQTGAIGGSMGDISVVVRGVDSPASAAALYSTVHGAGRVMSRTAAAGKVKWQAGPDGKKRPVRVAVGAISPEMLATWLTREDVVLRGAGLDEAPQAYRRLPEVLQSHAGTIAIEAQLRPLVVVMAGADTFDPYKD